MGIQACGEDCLNRLLMIECGKRCPCGDYCTNRSFQRRLRAPVAPIKTELKGWGLKALVDLKPNTFLIEYVGEVIGLKEFKRRCEKYSAQNNQHFYFMSLYNDLFIDATRKGNVSRFFNHSCDPNCETQKWTVNGELRIGFFTRRAIGANEELTFDYQFQTFGKKQQKCYCGSDKCRGFLGASASSNGTTSGQSAATTLEQIWSQEESSGGEEEDEEEEEDGEEFDEDGQRVVKKSTSKTSSPEKAAKSSGQKSKRDDKDHDVRVELDHLSSMQLINLFLTTVLLWNQRSTGRSRPLEACRTRRASSTFAGLCTERRTWKTVSIS